MIAGPLAGTGSRRTASAITLPLAPLLDRVTASVPEVGRYTPSSCQVQLSPLTPAGDCCWLTVTGRVNVEGPPLIVYGALVARFAFFVQVVSTL